MFFLVYRVLIELASVSKLDIFLPINFKMDAACL